MVTKFSKYLFFSVFALFTIMLPISSVYAGCVIDQPSYVGQWGGNDTGQSFTAPCTGGLYSITVYTWVFTVTGVTLTIYSGQSVDAGDQLHTQSNVTLTTSGTIILSDSVALTSGQQYTFRFTGGSREHTLRYTNDAGAYIGGIAYQSDWIPWANLAFKVQIASAPTASTAAASSVTSGGATLNGTVNASYGSAAVTFEYGTTDSYGTSVTADQSPVTGSTDTSVSKAITGLTQNTTYHYRVKGVNSADTAYGNDVTFTTLRDPTKVTLTGPATVLKDGLGAFTITALDSTDQQRVVTENTVFSLSSDSSGDSFYSDAAGTTAITSTSIPDGSSSVTFYGRDTAFGTPTLTATRTSGMTLGSDTLDIRISGNNALSFDGSGYVSIDSVFGLGTTDVTIESWVYIQSTSATGTIARLGTSDTGFGIGVGDGNFDQSGNELIVLIDAKRWIDTNVSIGTGWHHVAFSVGSENEVNIYLDGNNVYTEASALSAVNPSTPSYIGAGNSTTRIFSGGKIDEVRYWSDVRSATEIRANMHRELLGNENGLVAYYKMDTGTGTTASDSSGNSNDGTLTNGPTWQTSGALSGPGNALDFDGDDDYVLGSNRVMTNTDNWTIMGWVRLTALESEDQFAAYNGDDSGGYGFGFNNGQLRGLYGSVAWHTTGVFVTAETWNHVAMRRDSGILRFYLNGKLLDYSSTATPNTPSDLFTVGSQSNSRFLNGRVDELSFWDKALSAQEIRDNMIKSLQGDESGLAAYYRMDQQAVAGQITLYDQTPNGHNGTLTNMDPATDWVSSTAFSTWIGSNSTAWATPTNWSRGSVPATSSPYDNVGIPDYSDGTGYPAGNAPAISGAPTVNHFVLASDAEAALSSGLTVNGNLILENNLDLNGQAITLGTSATLFEDNGLLFGSFGIITTTRTYGAGDLSSGENIAGLGATLTTAAALGNTTITRSVAAMSHGDNDGIKRCYDINPTTDTGLNATLVFHYEDSELNGITESRLVLDKSTNEGTNWSQVEATLDQTANTLTATGLDSFSMWTASDSDSPLLVDLVSFTAQGVSDCVLLTWLTASEVDNAGFHLWRSKTRAGPYSRITPALIPAQGGPAWGATYTYNDTDVTLPQAWYYKLEDITNGGISTFHGPVLGVVGNAAVKVVSGPTTIGEGDTAPGMGEIIIEGTGQHTVTTGRYAANRAGAPTFTPTGDYWFVDVTGPSGLNSVTVRFCPAAANNMVYYWDGAGWVKCSQQEFTDGCTAVTISGTTSPPISDLTNLVFAMGSQSAAIPTVSEWGAIVLFLILATGGFRALRRRRSDV